jgi:hypothetical protein
MPGRTTSCDDGLALALREGVDGRVRAHVGSVDGAGVERLDLGRARAEDLGGEAAGAGCLEGVADQALLDADDGGSVGHVREVPEPELRCRGACLGDGGLARLARSLVGVRGREGGAGAEEEDDGCSDADREAAAALGLGRVALGGDAHALRRLRVWGRALAHGESSGLAEKGRKVEWGPSDEPDIGAFALR